MLRKGTLAQVLVTEQVWEAAGELDAKPLARESLRVRGREASLRVFRLA